MKISKEAMKRLRPFLMEGKCFTVDMTGGGRPYSDWNDKERKQARRAFSVDYGPPRVGWGIDGSKLPKGHPYHGLNDNGRRHAATSIHLEKFI